MTPIMWPRGGSWLPCWTKQAEYEPFDVIYVAPPQYKGMWRTALEMIDASPSWLTPEGLRRPVFDTEEIDGGLIILPSQEEREEEAAAESPRRRSHDDLVLMISLGIAFLAILGTILFTLTGIGSGFLGVETLDEPVPTERVLTFDVPACTSNSDGLTQLVFVNNTGLTIDIQQGAQGEEEPLITLSPDAQYTVEVVPDEPTRYAV
ncbi:MAG: hypothetical protein P8Z40_17515, partial [Chloroflexota bacterium]